MGMAVHDEKAESGNELHRGEGRGGCDGVCYGAALARGRSERCGEKMWVVKSRGGGCHRRRRCRARVRMKERGVSEESEATTAERKER